MITAELIPRERLVSLPQKALLDALSAIKRQGEWRARFTMDKRHDCFVIMVPGPPTKAIVLIGEELIDDDLKYANRLEVFNWLYSQLGIQPSLVVFNAERCAPPLQQLALAADQVQ